jgi:hypothetical protein
LEVQTNSANKGQREVASEEDVICEVNFFGEILHCFDTIFGLIRKKKDKFSTSDREKLTTAIENLNKEWHTQRCGEKNEASTTPKMHHLLFHLLPQSLYLGRFFQFMEDPIESLHRKDKEQNRIFAVATSFQVREERKRKREAMCDHVEVLQQTEIVKQQSTRAFRSVTIQKREHLKIEQDLVKSERRSFV